MAKLLVFNFSCARWKEICRDAWGKSGCVRLPSSRSKERRDTSGNGTLKRAFGDSLGNWWGKQRLIILEQLDHFES